MELVPRAIAVEASMAALLAAVVSDGSSLRRLAIWAVAWSLSALLSLAVRLRWIRRPQGAHENRRALWEASLAAGVRGSVWGLGIVWLPLPTASPAIDAALVMLALQTAAILTSGAALPVFGTGLLACAAPWTVAQFAGVDGGTHALGFAGLGFTALLMLVAWQIERDRGAIDSVERARNEALEQLARERQAACAARQQAESATAAARQAADDRMRFLSAASHDLRQPIHAIGLFVSALKEEVRTGRARYLIDRLDRSMSGLDELFNRVLEISRLDSGKITPAFSTFAIAPVLQTLESRFAPVAERRGLRLRVRSGSSQWIRSDPALLIEILMNLLSNALRYTERGGILLGTRRRGDRLIVQVWDTGPGIEPRELTAIFDEFVQLHGKGARRRGLGLGLAIVRRLGEVLDCPVSVRSRPGRGSVFQVSAPLAAEPATAPGQASEASSSLEGLLVLVVDDQMDILVGMEASLTSWGCFVLLARSVEELRQHLTLAERFPDFLITDHRLADGETSEDVVAAMSELVPVAVPVLVVSGDADPDLEHKFRRRGWSWMNKPANPDRLRALIAQKVSEAGDGVVPAA